MNEKLMTGEVWNEFCDSLKAAGQDVIEHSARDELERAEGFRYLTRLLHYGLKRSLERPALDPPSVQYDVVRLGANNPDFLYGSCRVRGTASYRITGNKHDAYTFSIGAFHGALGSAQGLQSAGYLALSDMHIEPDGHFEIIASREPVEGNWLQLVDETNQLQIRQTVLNPSTSRAAEFFPEVISGDLSETRSSLSADELENMLGMTALTVHGMLKQFIAWTEDFKQRPNEIHPIKPELLGFAKGDPNTQYNYCYFDVADEEALVIQLLPPACDYWNIQLSNHWMESFDSAQTPLSLNMSNTVTDEDGYVRVVVSKTNPGCVNWLDSQGHNRGVLALRWVNAEPQPLTPTKLFKLSALEQGVRF